MFKPHARWLVASGLAGLALCACSSDSTPNTGGGAGTASGGSAAGNQTAGSSSSAGTTSAAGAQSSGGSAGSTAAAGTGGTAAGAGGTTAGAGGGGGAGGGAAGGASGGGGAGGAASPTAVANITGLNGQTVTGTATFTQGADMTKLVIDLTACPDGVHASHLHEMKDCGMNGNAAGGHWMPNGVGLGDYTCANNKVTFEVSRPISAWTVGDGSATDVTKYSFMVHEMGDAGGNPGNRIGCGVIDKK